MAIIAIVLVLAGLTAAAVHAQSLGPVNEFLLIGDDPPWNGKVEADAYVLSNATDGSALQYFLAGYDKDDDGRRAIAVDVEIRQPGEQARAGLIYGYTEAPRAYFAFMLEPGGQVALYRRDESGFNRLMSTSGGQIGQGVNRLSIVEHGKQIELLVNGNQMWSFENEAVGHGNAGIAAAGIGVFAFKNYEQKAQ
jgi:hypothetical protein